MESDVLPVTHRALISLTGNKQSNEGKSAVHELPRLTLRILLVVLY